MLSTDTPIGIVGAGAMGAGIAQIAATAGHRVYLFDSNPAALVKAKEGLERTLAKLVEKQKLTTEIAAAIAKRHEYVSDLSSFRKCGLVIEAIVENLEVKQKLFIQLETTVPATCILASNTSSLSIASIGSACSDSSRVIGIHFFNPVPVMPLVEIIPSITTAPEVAVDCRKLIDSWNKQTVLAKDTPGFIVNRLARSFYGESIRIAEEGLADYATIDWALKEFGGFKMGPFELMDFIGNDINFKVTESVWEQFFYEARFKPSLTQKRLYEARLFGRKTGRGYYSYQDQTLPQEPKKDAALGQQIFNRVIAMLVNEAVDAYYLQLASKEDLDLAMTKGVNYPKGLLRWSDDIGQQKILDSLKELHELYEEERYRPCLLLKKMAANKTTFYN